MDKLDIQILRELTQAQSLLPAKPGLGLSYREIARKLDVSAGTVRNRISLMYSAGTIKGSSVYPNPRILDVQVGGYAIDIDSALSKSDVVEKLKLVDGMLFIQNFHGTLLGIAFVYEDEQSRMEKLDEFHRLAGARGGNFTRVLYPECTTSLTWPEWKLVQRLSERSFKTYGELAKEFEVSVRTLKRRIAKIISEKWILSVPTMDYKAIGGGLPADLIVSFTRPELRAEAETTIFSIAADYMIYAGVWEDFGMYSLVLPKVVAATELTDKVKQISGVKSLRMEFVDEHIDQTKAVLFYVEKQMKKIKPNDLVDSK
ncbi:MAG: Lrp/AsnC family transcriptional regulator [Nitrososphaerales archaeon]